MSVSRAVKKQEVKDELYRKLVETTVFPEQVHERGGEMEPAAYEGSSAGMDNEVSYSDPKVAVQLKELDLALKKTRT